MTKSTQKGNRIEKLAEDILHEWGFQTHRARKSGIFIKGRYFCHSNDIFKCIDIVAVKPEERTRWIQVTTLANKSAKLKKVRTVDWNFDFSDVLCWCYLGRGKWRLFELSEGQSKWVEYGTIEKRQFRGISLT